MLALDFVTYSFETGQDLLVKRSQAERKQHGQFLTPVAIARFMAKQLGPIRPGDRVLDPAIGSGVLACAVIERVIADGYPHQFWLDGYETDPELAEAARVALTKAVACAVERGIIVHTHIYEDDFVLSTVPSSQPYLFLAETSARSSENSRYSHIISNPPYFKLNSQDRRVKAATGQVKGHTNMYTLFLALAAKKLIPDGRASFIVPRSFCSGAYFTELRQSFIEEAMPEAVHLFSSRQDIFKQDSVLQENIILTFRRRKVKSSPNESEGFLNISALHNFSDLAAQPVSRSVSFDHFLGQRHGTFFFRLPTGQLDEDILEVVDGWPGSLGQYGLQVSTGPIVAFRARDWLAGSETVANQQAVPLLWMQNVKKQQVEWPVENGNKAQGFLLTEESRSLLVPTRNYLLLRRFSAKEEARRLVAAPFLADQYASQWIGLENHLNYIYKKHGSFEVTELFGLSALLNSALIDRYFRITNGNTQVNATELRALPLPPQEIIKEIGQQILVHNSECDSPLDIDVIVFNALRETGIISSEFPTFRETRINMGKIQEAQAVLQQLGLPKNQQNEMAALTLLILAQLSEDTPWQEANQQSLRIHDILLGIKDRYDREYAENTRETIRRQVIHQFEQAGLVVRNPDDLTLATNSPRTHYSLSEAAIRVIRTYQSPEWSQAVQTFVVGQGRLLEVYQKNRQRRKIPLRLADGTAVSLSPGQHNELQAAVIEEFGPRFAPGAKLLYLGDTARKLLIFDAAGFEALSISISGRDKLPDIVLYDEKRNWLFLIEAVTSHGPMSPKRHFELAKMMENCSAGCIYVSAFPDFATFKSFLAEIAWETEVWLAETPDHLIHFNGDRFLGPHT